jgi:hypothetical protein
MNPRVGQFFMTQRGQFRTAFDSVSKWSVSSGGYITKDLKVMGDYEGSLPDPGAQQLVELINAWCPLARMRMERWEPMGLNNDGLIQSVDALKMLQQAVLEIKRDPKQATLSFDRVFWNGLSVLCVDESGNAVSPNIRPGWDYENDKGVLANVAEGRIDKVAFMSRGSDPSQPLVPRKAYVTKVGGLACGVSYER